MTATAGFKVRRIPLRPPKGKEWEVKGWTGMYDSRSKKAEREEEATLLINLIPTDTERAGPVYLRAGRIPWSTPIPQVGLAAHLVQWLGYVHLTAAVAPPKLYAIADGEIWEIANPPVKRISAANLTAAGITFSATAESIRVVEFNGTMVVVGGGRPFTWDGTAGGGLVSLTNAPSSARAVAVYYAKLFFVEDFGTSHNTIHWSEENQANTGYVAGGYNNAWKLTQTSQEKVNELVGTNEGLYYFRNNSVGIIRGAVTASFQNDGVHDSITHGSGISSTEEPGHWALGSDAVFWSDKRGRIMAFRPGQGVSDLTAQIPRIYGGTAVGWSANNTSGQPVWGLGEDTIEKSGGHVNLSVDTVHGWLLVEICGSSLDARWVWLFDTVTYRLLSYWHYGTNHLNTADTIHAAVGTEGDDVYYNYADDLGFIFTQRLSTGLGGIATVDVDSAGVETPVVGTLLGPMHGHSVSRTEWHFTDLDVAIDQLDDTSTTIGYITSRLHKVSLTPADFTVVVSNDTADPYERPICCGLGSSAIGRWLRPIIKVTGNNDTAIGRQPPMIYGYKLRGVLAGESPSAK